MMMGRKTKITSHPTLFGAMVVLFFIWGFITLLNDLLIPVLRDKLSLSYAEAMLIQFTFFFTYFLMSIPMAKTLNLLNYKKGIILGLAIISLGCLIFIPADLALTYSAFLIGLFVLASGVVMLQVSANPLVTLLGSNETGSARLALAQGINSLGYVLAPILASSFIVRVNIYIPYIIIALIMLLVIIFINHFDFHSVDDQLKKEELTHLDDKFILWEHTPFVLGLISIFFYVGAEVSSGSLLVNFLNLPQVVNFPLAYAAKYLSIYWGGAMIGRLIGSYVLTKIHPPKVLSFNALVNLVLLCGVIFTKGFTAMWSLLLLGIFNSIMFPTIFALAISHLPYERSKNKASGFLIMAIVGGAIIPEIQGLLADKIGLQLSFLLLFVSYAMICYYGFYTNRLSQTEKYF